MKMRKTRSRKRLAAAAATAKSSIHSTASRNPDSRAAAKRRVAMGTAAALQRNPPFITRESIRAWRRGLRGAGASSGSAARGSLPPSRVQKKQNSQNR
ncbi:Hypothetical predicted protein [Marmota monax]|uniref:Uncharacterized protein n=1 Tax=Marmota monax TaxID=9995 RepID=A0A5E4BNJ9_MARMO|nr:hypothetical protein GHT09_007952 [Marmota monax]VTJ71137.1 Hypothetical predicted protein [Marmota monax]